MGDGHFVLAVKLFVKGCFGKTVGVHLRYNELESVTGLHLKEKIQTLTGYPVNQQQLIFGGKQLEDDRLLVSCGIQHESTIELTQRLQGGGLPSGDPGRDGMGDKDGKNRSMEHLVLF
ncbi:uncharacterized protein LOC131989939 [Centropristis striata]|uniref:uncharacterized protein LOC131989939 n=1 Tax=Centropristis striata TaxID=184440 RepID=UPI0027E1E663|nr:uncharacterized protein LOC131989939 [Centropristis striata]XP_059211306.1 uncharacterized protein LOC131989939 [Centropristis striata]